MPDSHPISLETYGSNSKPRTVERPKLKHHKTKDQPKCDSTLPHPMLEPVSKPKRVEPLVKDSMATYESSVPRRDSPIRHPILERYGSISKQKKIVKPAVTLDIPDSHPISLETYGSNSKPQTVERPKLKHHKTTVYQPKLVSTLRHPMLEPVSKPKRVELLVKDSMATYSKQKKIVKPAIGLDMPDSHPISLETYGSNSKPRTVERPKLKHHETKDQPKRNSTLRRPVLERYGSVSKLKTVKPLVRDSVATYKSSVPKHDSSVRHPMLQRYGSISKPKKIVKPAIGLDKPDNRGANKKLPKCSVDVI